jgi:hypothetical protein
MDHMDSYSQLGRTTILALMITVAAWGGAAVGQTPPEAASPADQAPFKIEMEKNRSAEAGREAVIVIRLRSGLDRITGFSFLIAFDTTNVAFRKAEPGGFIKGRGWEHFSAEPVTVVPGDTIAPVNLLRLTADFGAGVAPDTLQKSSSGLVRLVFYLDTKRAVDCKNYPVRFFWRTCDDNLVLAGPEKTPYYALEVHDLESAWSHAADPAEDCMALGPKLPETPVSCRGDKVPAAQRGVVYFDGGIEGYCAEYSQVLGDIDLNGLPNQETDVAAVARLLVHGFLCGYQTDSMQFLLKSLSRSPSDSISLSISSLVHANRIVTDDAIHSASPELDSILLDAPVTSDSLTISYISSTRLGAMMFILKTDSGATVPVMAERAFGRQAAYGRYNNRLCLIVYDVGPTSLPQGKCALGGFGFPGMTRLISAKAVDYYGRPVKVILPGK